MSTKTNTPLIEDIELHVTMLHFIFKRRSFAKSVFNREWIKFKMDFNCNESPAELKDLFHCDLMKKDLVENFDLQPNKMDYFKHANIYANHSIAEIRSIFADSEAIAGSDFRIIAEGFDYSSEEDVADDLIRELKLKKSVTRKPQGWFQRASTEAPAPIKIQIDPILPPNFKRPIDQVDLDREADWITLGSLALITPAEKVAGVVTLTSHEIIKRFLNPQVDALTNLPLSVLKYLSEVTKLFGDDLKPLIASKEAEYENKNLVIGDSFKDIESDSYSDKNSLTPRSFTNSIIVNQGLAQDVDTSSDNSMVRPPNVSSSSDDTLINTTSAAQNQSAGRHVAGNTKMDRFISNFYKRHQ